ncbi:MAG: argininosuccinate lyase [Spirochaetales bacterium]|nr:argininosuccinate lyase [Spirochaetales bacterium]
MATLWQVGGGPGLDPAVDRFLSSITVDSRLVLEDIVCSQAHAIMLGEQGILPAQDAAALVDELSRMRREIEQGTLTVDLQAEDVHSFLETELTRRLGDIGKSIHAGRSRNDQVAAAFRLHVRNSCFQTRRAVLKAVQACLTLAQPHTGTLMPGYTHLQRAQPVTLAHHVLAWCAALERDAGRLADAARRADESPLGSGALAGSGLPIDRERTATLIGFAKPSANTMDAVADRDWVIEYASAAAILMMHLSRACEDIVLWASSEYGFVRIGPKASTGSSIMPQKRNPDPAELIRGKAGRVFGALQALLVMEKGLPYAYNRDLQEDKELFFDIETTVNGALDAFSVLVSSLQPDVGRMRAALRGGFPEATDVAELLVKHGIPFRTSYQAAKLLVQRCVEADKSLSEIGPEDLAVHEAFAETGLSAAEVAAYLDLEACVQRRMQVGGPAPLRTREQIERLSAWVAEELAQGSL